MTNNRLLVILMLMLSASGLHAQCECIPRQKTPPADSTIVLYGTHKVIPDIYKAPILLALSHFPELRDTRIRFRVRHAQSPLTTNRDWRYYFAHFGLGRRAFVVTISDSTTTKLSPILFGRLPFDAKVGVAGHELSHVSDFRHKNLFGWLRLGAGHLSSRYVDRLEFATDSLCIAHGLGYSLLAWSCFVRSAFGLQPSAQAGNSKLLFKGRERYMNPSTILLRLKNGNTPN
ncbi:hypothetical protein [Puia dinghuensis]|uniref:Peptidase M48 domain-containing protein n=1 Tax=Puia dinghuensis TaxID=1792502 RepID=A0A8J2XUH2_9BACT|nr:hypothetical protein [Puia dinghuensis]GGB12570.1 hypothetical protein GCM10011511_40250 [Puia dinghuensis]